MTETARALTCPQCGGTIALRAAGVSVTLVCEHCGTALDATREDVRVIAAAATAMRVPPIPLGTRGIVRGTQWEVVGYVERADAWVQWCEYLLFNPYEGYAFLGDDGRRYSLGRLLDRVPGSAWNGLTLDDAAYTRFGDPYDVRVTFVVGEFYWRIAVGEEVRATDYVRPGAMLSCEEDGRERTWTLLHMLDRGEAERAFGADRRLLGWADTPAPHEPSPYIRLLKEALIIVFAATAAMLLISMVGGGRDQMLARTMDVPLDAGTRSAVLGPVRLTARYSRVTISARARALDNAWIDLDYSLVNRRTQESFDSYTVAEYFHGRDSEGLWNEGDRSPEVVLASIPGGTYDLVVEATAKRWVPVANAARWSGDATPSGGVVPTEITVYAGGSSSFNLAIALILVALWPIALLELHGRFEKRRMSPVTEDA